jgi:hypothetical protein
MQARSIAKSKVLPGGNCSSSSYLQWDFLGGGYKKSLLLLNTDSQFILLHSMPNKNPIINRSTERKQRQLYQQRTKYIGKRRRHQPPLPQVTPSMKHEKNGGWGSLFSKHPTILGHKLNAQLEDWFLTTHDPSRIMDFYATSSKFPEKQASHIRSGQVNINLRQVLISSIKYPRCYSSSTDTNNVIIDSGASVCISPHKSDFITCGPNGMKIEDLSSTNKAAGEGLIQWDLQDKKRSHSYNQSFSLPYSCRKSLSSESSSYNR